MAEDIGNTGLWYNVLGAALMIPGAQVDRKEFLAREFKKYCNSETVEKIIKCGTLQAGIETRLMDKIADEAITFHTGIAASLSFAAGIPGGLTMLAAIPADIAQYYYHVIVIAQKLAYIYGLADMGMADDNFKSLLTLLVGVMVDIEDADKTVLEIFSAQVKNDVTAAALAKGLNKIVIGVAVKLSYALTGKAVFKSVWTVIPLVGGIVSGGITLFTFKPMCKKLKEKLRKSTKTICKALSLKVVK